MSDKSSTGHSPQSIVTMLWHRNARSLRIMCHELKARANGSVVVAVNVTWKLKIKGRLNPKAVMKSLQRAEDQMLQGWKQSTSDYRRHQI